MTEPLVGTRVRMRRYPQETGVVYHVTLGGRVCVLWDEPWRTMFVKSAHDADELEVVG